VRTSAASDIAPAIPADHVPPGFWIFGHRANSEGRTGATTVTAISESRGSTASKSPSITSPFDQDTSTGSRQANLAPRIGPNLPDVTQQLPVIRASYVELPRWSGTRSQPAPQSARRAPLALRLSVMGLLIILVAALGGSIYARGHPKWLIGLRDVIPAITPVSTTTAALTTNRVELASSSATAVVYRIPAQSYALIVTVDHPTWIEVHAPATSSSLLIAETRSPSTGPLRIALSSTASVTLAAQAVSISIATGSRTLDTIAKPALGVAYTFEPESPGAPTSTSTARRVAVRPTNH
jgi:hypothetical protein